MRISPKSGQNIKQRLIAYFTAVTKTVPRVQSFRGSGCKFFEVFIISDKLALGEPLRMPFQIPERIQLSSQFTS